MHENVFSYVTLNVNTIVHNKKLTIVIVYRQVIEKNNSKYKSCQFQRCKQVIKFDSAYKISIVIAHCTYKHCQSKIAIMHTKVLKCNCSYKRSQLQYSIKTFTIKMMRKNWTIAIHKIVVNCTSANKSYQLQFCKQSCLLQLVHTKAIAASTQSCDFF